MQAQPTCLPGVWVGQLLSHSLSMGSRCFLTLLGGGIALTGPLPWGSHSPHGAPRPEVANMRPERPPVPCKGPGALRTPGPGLKESPSLIHQQPHPQVDLPGFAVTEQAPGGQWLNEDRHQDNGSASHLQKTGHPETGPGVPP